ncbi:TRAP transporter substrate-binding protein [Roseibium aggregatum]|uniref:TRAP transporter substrate-binding protein n=1 Tax=Roseibium aggregatum TaxID=187304 RepID=A0A939J4Y1_9HYPH|nr:TRAP transporter substrate-binding protein [Roseibium aggregatum]MBN9672102.1 TRAP transporter substrate-binding protein [Roseibium aggregatum]
MKLRIAGKTVRGLVAATLVATTGLASAFPAFAADKVLKFAHVLQTNHPYHDMALKFKEELEARNVGLSVEIFPAAQLGNESELISGLQLGSVDIATITSAVTANFVPDFQVFSLPFIFRDAGHLFRVMDGKIGDEMAAKMQDVGLVKLGYGYGGTRDLYTSKAVHKLDDLQGLKIRTMKNTAIIDTWNALGAVATPVAWSDVPVSLKQGLIDGGEGTGVSYRSMAFYEDTKYFTRLAYIFSWHNLMMSKITFDGLSKEQQSAVLDAAKIAESYERTAFLDQEAALFADLATKGAEIITPEDRADWIARIKDVYAQNADDLGGLDRIEAIQNY